MDLLGSMNIGYSALKAQTARLNVISSNIANMGTTRTPEGGPYLRKSVVFGAAEGGFEQELADSLGRNVHGVRVERIVSHQDDVKRVYDPGHPDADKEGYVRKPDINLAEELTDLLEARGSYEANVTSIKAAQRMAVKALEIGR